MKVRRAELANVDLPRKIRSSLLIMVEACRSLFEGLYGVKRLASNKRLFKRGGSRTGGIVQVLESLDVSADMGPTSDLQNGFV